MMRVHRWCGWRSVARLRLTGYWLRSWLNSSVARTSPSRAALWIAGSGEGLAVGSAAVLGENTRNSMSAGNEWHQSEGGEDVARTWRGRGEDVARTWRG
jgi:hypothetical protein